MDSAPAPETRVILQQRKRVVREAMEGLRPDQKEALEMSFFFGYTHSEVARKLGVPLGTIKSRVRTGMQNLRERLAPLIENEGGRS
jgi:RNA polymerase sigma-70 factor (ECF subfamily)